MDGEWFMNLRDESGFPIYLYIMAIAGILFLALCLVCICRCCCRKKKNRINKNADFSDSEEERRATVVRSAVLSDIAKRENSISRSSYPG